MWLEGSLGSLLGRTMVLMVWGWLHCLFSGGCCPHADTAAFATSGLVAQCDSSHENLDLEVVVSVDVLETQGS